jgi:hypothetical protein
MAITTLKTRVSKLEGGSAVEEPTGFGILREPITNEELVDVLKNWRSEVAAGRWYVRGGRMYQIDKRGPLTADECLAEFGGHRI